jgi:hypothetical protein
MLDFLGRWFTQSPKSPQQDVQEFLYLDKDRLAAYVDQLRAPVTYDKVPSWTAELSASGAVAKAGQTRTQRTYTPFEQLAYLERSLIESEQLAAGRWLGDKLQHLPTFRRETCFARRALLTEQQSGRQQAIWVSRYNPIAWTGRPTTLVLFEGSRAKDSDAQYLSEVSRFLVYIMAEAPAVWTPAAIKKDVKECADFGHAFKRVSNRLALDPFGFLEQLDARIFPERCITTTYRVRSAFTITAPKMIPAVVSLGYPISIAAASPERIEGEAEKYANNPGSAEIPNELHEQHLQITAELLAKCGESPGEIDEAISKLRSDFARGEDTT